MSSKNGELLNCVIKIHGTGDVKVKLRSETRQ